ncbi:MAG TPA: SusC/RagA family TonB-linked outer membrane protein [Flavisolibacter sp.]|jgi:TonB-linked SusC/RagA family outer membrane protein|nr:SusC/RagA family TonB-linked outer membrane protein [Flavisolibacter sp.]
MTAYRMLMRAAFSFFFVLLSVSLIAQQFTARGKVADPAQKPVSGATVTNTTSKAVTVTDATGNFSIVAQKGDELLFSFIGFETHSIKAENATFLDVVLTQAAANMTDVMVTALGIRKEKARLGYAAQDVKGEQLVKAREPNLVNSLTGRVAGLRITNSTDLFQDAGISLRGRRPLIVIDGVPDQSADMWKINADDVESITVLKGPNASALYGSIGQNGAIMITTKRGRGKDLAIEVNSSTIFQPGFIRIPTVQTTYGNGNKGRYAYVNGSGGGTEGAGWIWGPKLDRADPSTPSGYWETPQYNSPVDPVTGARQPMAWISRGKGNVRNFFRTGLITSNNVSFSKGGENGSFRISGGHIYQRGIVPNTDLNNTSFSIAGNYAFSKAFSVDSRLTYNREYTDNFPETGYGPTNYLYNLVLWTGVDVDIRDLRNYWEPGKEGVQQRHYNNSWYNNPYFQAYEFQRGYYKDNIFGSLDLKYAISPSFTAKFRTGVNGYGLNRTYKEPKSYVGYSNRSRGNFTTASANYMDIITDLQLRYEHDFGSNLSVHAEIGGSNYYRNHKYQSVNTDGLTIPGVYNLANSANPLQGSNGLEERRTASLYGFVDVELMKAFYLTLTGRQDQISTLPVANNSYFYPSVSGSVILSRLVRLPQVISFAKLRGGWSRVSSATLNDNAYTYAYIQAYDKGNNWNNAPALTYGSAQLNPDIHPQTSDSWEAGVELKLLKNRIGIDATVYSTLDYNNIVSIPVSVTSGYSSRLENGNVYQRQGFELVVSANPVQTKNFRWDLTTNWSTYRRYLKEIYGGATQLNRLKVGDRTDRIFDWVYETDGQGNVVFQSNGFPKWDQFTRYIGNNDPDWIYGLENSFQYKAFSLRFLVDGRIGGLLYSTTNQKMWWGGTHPGTVNAFRDDANENKATFVGPGVVVTGGDIQYNAEGEVIKDTRTFAPNTKAVNYIDYMINTSNAIATNYNYYAETFLKLREVTLTWQLPSILLQKAGFKGASISVVGRNLLLFSKLDNVDPDPGSDNLQTPSTRNIGFNLNLRF